MADCTPQALAAAASCLRCIPKRRPVRTYLLCQWANNLCDEDAEIFLAAANITDEDVRAAICQLVKDLKENPASGTKYWNRETLLYPFAQNPGDSAAQMAVSHSVNLRTPGTNNLTYVGTPVHSVLGMRGTNVINSGYATTSYFIPVARRNDIRAFWYLDLETTINAQYYFGCASTLPTCRFYSRASLASNLPISIAINDDTGFSPYSLAASQLGAWIMQRSAVNVLRYQTAYWGQPFLISPPALDIPSTGVPQRELTLLMYDNATPPGGTSSLARLSGFSLGLPLSGDAEWAEYSAIWQRYQTAMGRART